MGGVRVAITASRNNRLARSKLRLSISKTRRICRNLPSCATKPPQRGSSVTRSAQRSAGGAHSAITSSAVNRVRLERSRRRPGKRQTDSSKRPSQRSRPSRRSSGRRRSQSEEAGIQARGDGVLPGAPLQEDHRRLVRSVRVVPLQTREKALTLIDFPI